MARLKPQYETFCQNYAGHPNAGAAAKVAGYSALNCDKQGWRLLQRPEIVARIAELRAEQAARDSLSLTALLSKLENAYHIAYEGSEAMVVARIAEIEAKLPALFAKAGMGEAVPPGAEPTRAALIRIARQLGVPAPQDAAPKRGT